MMSRVRIWPYVAVSVGTLVLLSVVSPSVSAKPPPRWEIKYLDTGEVVWITDANAALRFHDETHYSVTGGTPVQPDPSRRPTAVVMADPCNPPYSCPRQYYVYYAAEGQKTAYMNYYLADGTLYYSWTTPDLEARMHAYRTLPAPQDSDFFPALSIVAAVGASLAGAWAFRRFRRRTEGTKRADRGSLDPGSEEH